MLPQPAADFPTFLDGTVVTFWLLVVIIGIFLLFLWFVTRATNTQNPEWRDRLWEKNHPNQNTMRRGDDK